MTPPPAPPERRVLVPATLPATALRGKGSDSPVVRLEGVTMGTFWNVRCAPPRGVSEAAIRETLEAVFAKVIAQMSHWDERSDLCAFNRAPAGARVALPAEFHRVLTRALEVAAASGGCFDPTLGEIVDLHGFGPSPPPGEEPAPPALARAARRCGWKKLELDPVRQTARQPGGLRLDLSSIAKGFAVDLAAEALEAMGVFSHLVEIGGEVRGSGCKPDGEPWWCLLESPAGPGAERLPETIVALCGVSLATSGDGLRRRETPSGEIAGHLIDPRTLRSANGALTSVSVFAPDCMTADAWATALFIAGEDGPSMAEEQSLAALFTWRAPDGFQQTWTTALAEMME